jgi:hypothetical protein
MAVGLSNCVRAGMAVPPGFVLNWVSGVMRFYPWYLRIGFVLQRFVQ